MDSLPPRIHHFLVVASVLSAEIKFPISDKGRLYSPGDSGDKRQLDIAGGISIPEQSFERLGSAVNTDQNQKFEWIRGIQGGPVPLSSFDFASVLTESMLLGNVAVRLGQAIRYDAHAGRVTNISAAAGLVSRVRREG